MIGTSVSALIQLSHGTSSEWMATNVAIPKGVFCYEVDTQRTKIGDGSQLYRDLPYHTRNIFSSQQAQLLENPNTADSVIRLTAEGQVPLDTVDPVFKNGIKAVTTLTDRDNIPSANKPQSLVLVADASDDPDVMSGSAVYAFSAAMNQWTRLVEFESFDIDTSSFITTETGLDRLTDSTSFVRMKANEKARTANVMVEQPERYLWQNRGPSLFISDFNGEDETNNDDAMTVIDMGNNGSPTFVVDGNGL